MTPAYATSAPPDATETVTASNTLDHPYKSITVSGSLANGIQNINGSDLTVYLADDFTGLSATSLYDDSQAIGIEADRANMTLVGKQASITAKAENDETDNARAGGITVICDYNSSKNVILGDNVTIKATAVSKVQGLAGLAVGIENYCGSTTMGDKAVLQVTAEGKAAIAEAKAIGSMVLAGTRNLTITSSS